MEDNASNALVMAGGVLLAIMILSLIVFTFKTSADFAKSYEENVEKLNLQAFNNQFEIYNREDITIQDMITVANLAKDINIKNGLEDDSKSPYYVQVLLYNGSKSLEKMSNSELIKFMEDNTFKDSTVETQKYKCKGIEYNPDTNKVSKIIFEKVD